MLRRSIGASSYLGTHVEECWAQEDMWNIARGGVPCVRILWRVKHHGRGSAMLTTCWTVRHLGGEVLCPRGIMLGGGTTLGSDKTLV
jgi:hypothetical protein